MSQSAVNEMEEENHSHNDSTVQNENQASPSSTSHYSDVYDETYLLVKTPYYPKKAQEYHSTDFFLRSRRRHDTCETFDSQEGT